MSFNPSLVDIAVMCRRLYEVPVQWPLMRTVCTREAQPNRHSNRCISHVLGNSFLVSALVMIVVVIETATMSVFSAFFLHNNAHTRGHGLSARRTQPASAQCFFIKTLHSRMVHLSKLCRWPSITPSPGNMRGHTDRLNRSNRCQSLP